MNNLDEAAIRKTIREEAYQRGYAQAMKDAYQACASEYLEDGTGTEEDAAYDRAVADCMLAIRALTPSAPAPVVPKVTPLVWESGLFKHRNGHTYTKHAYSSHGPYYVNDGGWCGPGVSVDYVSPGTDVMDYVNRIHEARVLSQIETTPVTVQEAARILEVECRRRADKVQEYDDDIFTSHADFDLFTSCLRELAELR